MEPGSGTGTPITASVAPTDAETLAAIKLAIYNNAVAGGLKAYNIGGKRVEFDLEAMERQRDKYQALVDNEARGGAVVLGGLSDTV